MLQLVSVSMSDHQTHCSSSAVGTGVDCVNQERPSCASIFKLTHQWKLSLVRHVVKMSITQGKQLAQTNNGEENFMIIDINNAHHSVQRGASVINESFGQETAIAPDVLLDRNSAVVATQEQKSITPST